jgi:hypothetical protein
MRRVSMTVRDELVAAIAERYRSGLRWEKARILDEFVAVTGYHRKHAMRVLREGRSGERSGPRPARRIYDEAVREALVLLWEASDRLCGKRLKPLLPVLIEGMERHGHLQLAADVRAALLAVSALGLSSSRAFPKTTICGGIRQRSSRKSAICRARARGLRSTIFGKLVGHTLCYRFSCPTPPPA